MPDLKRFKVFLPEQFLYVEAETEEEALALAVPRFSVSADDLIAALAVKATENLQRNPLVINRLKKDNAPA